MEAPHGAPRKSPKGDSLHIPVHVGERLRAVQLNDTDTVDELREATKIQFGLEGSSVWLNVRTGVATQPLWPRAKLWEALLFTDEDKPLDVYVEREQAVVLPGSQQQTGEAKSMDSTLANLQQMVQQAFSPAQQEMLRSLFIESAPDRETMRLVVQSGDSSHAQKFVDRLWSRINSMSRHQLAKTKYVLGSELGGVAGQSISALYTAFTLDGVLVCAKSFSPQQRERALNEFALLSRLSSTFPTLVLSPVDFVEINGKAIIVMPHKGAALSSMLAGVSGGGLGADSAVLRSVCSSVLLTLHACHVTRLMSQ